MSQVSIDWGDGNVEEQDVTVDENGNWELDDQTHTYDEPGRYRISVAGVAGGVGSDTVTVRAPDPTLTALEPDTAAIGGADFNGHIRGTGFTEDTVIVWDNGDEPTHFVDSTDVWTVVKPSVVTAPTVLPVTVRNGSGDEVDPPLEFTWTAAAPPPFTIDTVTPNNLAGDTATTQMFTMTGTDLPSSGWTLVGPSGSYPQSFAADGGATARARISQFPALPPGTYHWENGGVQSPPITITQSPIQSFTPASAVRGSTVVTVKGVGFTGTTSAALQPLPSGGASSATVTVVDDTTMTFVVPVATAPGQYAVRANLGAASPTRSAVGALTVTA